ncbi:flagellar basal body rod protein FlgC [Longimicrobium sp.]|uniref:flagellar basal body rod protein FlgC n=1 Tax=Longimicrobium sp. TaxID=2029185 RepID=UPI002E30C5F0|nr:flagellar basal body rod protein FlgC [Longimicrobium sp.]HEX6039390.1 flagellar basal body rod protein FlgC [Longimicrobium sp.]
MPDPIGGFPPDPYRPVVRPMFRTLAIASSGLSAQRMRIETVATNIANAETTRAADGTPYRRRVVRMEAGEIPGQPFELGPDGLPALGRLPGGEALQNPLGVRVAAVEEDATEGALMYDPGHPDANADGYVRMPNVRVTDELVELMDARRVYEANATVFQSAKAMLRASINL